MLILSPIIPPVQLALSVRRLSEAAVKRVARGQIVMDDYGKLLPIKQPESHVNVQGENVFKQVVCCMRRMRGLRLTFAKVLREILLLKNNNGLKKGKKRSVNERKIRLKDLLIFRLEKLQIQQGKLLKQRLLLNGKLVKMYA